MNAAYKLVGLGYYSITVVTIFIISLGLFSNSPEAFADTKIVSIPSGTSVPGCETTNECFIPYTAQIHPGDDVTWENNDSAAHTVTSGVGTPDGNFDSSLFMAGTTFSVTFDDVGQFPYYCMVHPWMLGEVNVEYEIAFAPAPVPEAPESEPEVVEELALVPEAPEFDWQSLYYDANARVHELEIENGMLEVKVGELEDKKDTLEEKISELEDTIKNLNALAREQLKVIYEWVVGR